MLQQSDTYSPTTSSNPDPYCRELEEAALRLYHPGNARPHPVEWVPNPQTGRRFVGVSMLVKNPATAYAKRIMRAVEEVDVEEGFWGEQGNALAEYHLRQITPYRENQVRLILRAKCVDYPDSPVIARYPQLDDKPNEEWDHLHEMVSDTEDGPFRMPCNGKTFGGWDFVGHFDGVTLHPVADLGIEDAETDFRLAMREHKVQDPDEGEPGGNVDRACRQGLTYGGMVDEMFEAGACFALKSDLMGPDCRLAPLAPVELLILHFWPRTAPPAKVEARRLQKWEKVMWLDFYRRKAFAVIKSVEAYEAMVEAAGLIGDGTGLTPDEVASKRVEFEKAALAIEGGAYEWDDSPDGVQEFKRTVTAIQAGLPTTPFRELVEEVVNAKKSRDQWDVLARDREASAVALMTQREVRSVMVTEDDGKTEVAKATIVGGEGRASWLKVTPRTKKVAS